MAALADDALQALWSIFDASGVRPEYLIPVLYFESGFNPSASNAGGAAYYGVAQTSGARLAALGTRPSAYLAMTAAQQITLAVAPYFASVVASYGPIGSATRAEQANFLPASLATARSLSQLLATSGTAVYGANAGALDPLRHGAITVGDLALAMGKAARAAPSRAAIARAYVLRPQAYPPREAVFGSDFASPALSLVGLLGAIGLALRHARAF